MYYNQLSRIIGQISGGDMQEQKVDQLKAIPEELLALMKEANFISLYHQNKV
jgi:hypothetical protein